MHGKFTKRLRTLLQPQTFLEQRAKMKSRHWNEREAQCLSLEIHEFEASGGNLTKTEERLWERLTARLEQA